MSVTQDRVRGPTATDDALHDGPSPWRGNESVSSTFLLRQCGPLTSGPLAL